MRAVLLGRATLAAFLLLVGSAVARGDAPRLEFPVACRPGADCWLFQYFDHDPGAGWRDYACGKRSYDGHHGTDIAIRDIAAIGRGFPVLAAAAGTVRNVRDGMEDVLLDDEGAAALAGRDCGNGVAIVHGEGWETQYCHLRKGSVRVRPGQTVAAGQVLGEVGLSGTTRFPHVEFVVRHQGRPIDPFTGKGPPAACDLSPGHLWSERALERVRYSPVDILAAGFAPDRPSPDEVYAGRLAEEALPADAPALIGWTVLAAVRRGDRLTLTVEAPDGATLAKHATVLERDQIRYLAYTGAKRRGATWPEGTYRLSVRLERGEGGQNLAREATASVAVR